MIFSSNWRDDEPHASVLRGGVGSSTNAEWSETGYTKLVSEAGFSLDFGFILRGEIARVSAAVEGSRNTTLFRASIELMRCGIDPTVLIPFSIAGGLPASEASRVVTSAEGGFSDQYGSTVLEFVEEWLATWVPRFPSRYRPVLMGIAAAAVRQNNRSPLVVQSSLLDLGMFNQSTISRWFSQLHARGAVVRKPRGMGSKGRRPNFYEMRLPSASD